MYVYIHMVHIYVQWTDASFVTVQAAAYIYTRFDKRYIAARLDVKYMHAVLEPLSVSAR